MTENHSGPTYSPQIRPDPHAEMAVFDGLPAELRAVLRATAMNYGSAPVRTLLSWGVPVPQIIAEIGRHEALNHRALVDAGLAPA